MKIKTEELKKIVEEVVKDALSEQEAATTTRPDPKVKDADKAKMKLDAQNALIALLQFIDTPAEIEEFVRSIIVRLDPRKVTDQELFVSFKNLFQLAREKKLVRKGKAGQGT